MTGRFGRIARGYEATALILLNFLVFVLVLNLLLGAGYAVRDARSGAEAGPPSPDALFLDDGTPVQTGTRTRHHLDWIDFHAYERSPEHVAAVLDGFYERSRQGFIYQPWVQFSEPPLSTPLVNIDVDERGFTIRRTVQEPVPEGERVVRVFAMGGSTTQGEYVADEDTWPTHLSRVLNERARAEGLPFAVEVVNYGRGYYFPGQQAMLLQDLLKSGHRPSLVIFMDGVNWGGVRDQPQLTPDAARAFIERQFGRRVPIGHVLARFDWIPMVRLVRSVRQAERVPEAEPDDGGGDDDAEERDAFYVNATVNRFEQGAAVADAVCELYGCRIAFFLQPHAQYRYDLELYRRELPERFTGTIPLVAAFYERMRESERYLDLSHLFEAFGRDRRAIVDDVHYSPAFGRFLAETVAGHIDLAGLPVFERIIDESAATGLPRSMVTREGRIVPR